MYFKKVRSRSEWNTDIGNKYLLLCFLAQDSDEYLSIIIKQCYYNIIKEYEKRLRIKLILFIFWDEFENCLWTIKNWKFPLIKNSMEKCL